MRLSYFLRNPTVTVLTILFPFFSVVLIVTLLKFGVCFYIKLCVELKTNCSRHASDYV
jgi:hypothetical protein